MSKVDPPQYLVTDRVSEDLRTEMAHCCDLFKIICSPRKSDVPSTNALEEEQNEKIVAIFE